MGRTADIKTRAVATRVLTADYIKILQESSGRGISVSDYISEKLSFQETKLEKGGGVGTEVIKEVDKKETLDKVKKLESEVLSLKTENSALKSPKTSNTTVFKDIDAQTIKYLDELFKINKTSSSLLQNRVNPYYDVVNKIEQKLDLLKKKQ